MKRKVANDEVKIDGQRPLYISFHGRVLEHLGIQMYQSPVNALAEFVANAWDAEAKEVRVLYPSNLDPGVVIVIADNGLGMTREECQKRFLYVGHNRRLKNPDERSPNLKRHILGRKGIGKFAGFGIAEIIRVDTISRNTGERTIFELDLNDLMGEDYIGKDDKQVREIHTAPPATERIGESGTVITLSKLRLKQNMRSDFPESLARKFSLLERQTDFQIKVNGRELPRSLSLVDIQYLFPRDYSADEKPGGITKIDQETGWGQEKLADGNIVRWRFMFHEKTIDQEELRGIAIYAKGKLVQAPFLFHITGGLGGQHGIEYLTGQVEADYLDSLSEDIMATERQRVNWEHPAAAPLIAWGQQRLKELLAIWRDRRGAERREQVEKKVLKFSKRLEKLPRSEARTVRRAIEKIGAIETLTDDQFEDLAQSVLTSWEQGRLKELIGDLSNIQGNSEKELINVLVEEGVLSALNIAETVKTKILAVGELKRHVKKGNLENEVRDHLAANPWLIHPDFQTYSVETALKKTVEQAAGKNYIPTGKYGKRTDLILSHNDHLVLLEFMRPGLQIDWDHISRYKLYFRSIKAWIDSNTGGRFRRLTGYIVADTLEKSSAVNGEIQSMAKEEMFALDWKVLLDRALSGWRQFLKALASREPRDPRLKALLDD